MNARTQDDGTPLHYAARYGHKDVAELLLAEGADVNAKDDFAHTPLHHAAQAPIQRSAATVELLIAHGADANAKDYFVKTPLHYAAQSPTNRSAATAELLLANGADANAKDLFSKTPLHYAAISGDAFVAELLLAKNTDVNAIDREGVSALHDAIKKGHRDIAEILKKYGAKDLADKEILQREEEEESRRRQAAEEAKPAYVKVIEASANAWPYSFADLRAALSMAEGQADFSPELLSPLLILYQRAAEKTHYGGNRSKEVWAHIERFERFGSRKHFEESAIIKEMSLRLITKVAARPGSGEVLSRVRLSMDQGRDNFDPLLDDSAENTSSRSSYCKTIELIDRLMKS